MKKTILGLLGVVASSIAATFLVSCGTTTPGPASASSENIRQPEPTVSHRDVLKEINQSKTFISQKKYREAEILLTRAVSSEDSNFEAWDCLVKVHLALAEQCDTNSYYGTVDATLKDYKSAGNQLDIAKLALLKMRGLAIQSDAKCDPGELVLVEKQYIKTKDRVYATIAMFCKLQLQGADTWAWSAIDHPIHRILPNNRSEVVLGLKALKPVIALKAWAGEDNQIQLTRLYLKLKGGVNPDEWPGLLAQAGIVNGEIE